MATKRIDGNVLDSFVSRNNQGSSIKSVTSQILTNADNISTNSNNISNNSNSISSLQSNKQDTITTSTNISCNSLTTSNPATIAYALRMNKPQNVIITPTINDVIMWLDGNVNYYSNTINTRIDTSTNITHLLPTIMNSSVSLSTQTALRVLTLDSNKNIVSSSTTTTQLGYLDATSSVQTQLNGKQSSITNTTDFTMRDLTLRKIVTNDNTQTHNILGKATVGTSSDSKGTLTNNFSSTTTKSNDTDIQDANRAFANDNVSTTTTNNMFSAICLQLAPTMTLTTGRAIGDIMLIRETLTTSSFMMSAFQGSTYRDIAKFGYANSFVRGFLKVNSNATPSEALDVNGNVTISGTTLTVNSTPIHSSRVVYNSVSWSNTTGPTWNDPTITWANGSYYKLISFTSGYVNNKIRGTIINLTNDVNRTNFLRICPSVSGNINNTSTENNSWYLRRSSGWIALDNNSGNTYCIICISAEQNCEISFEIDTYRRIISGGRQQIQFKCSWTERNIGCVKTEGSFHITNATNDIDGMYIFFNGSPSLGTPSWSGYLEVEGNK